MCRTPPDLGGVRYGKMTGRTSHMAHIHFGGINRVTDLSWCEYDMSFAYTFPMCAIRAVARLFEPNSIRSYVVTTNFLFET